MDKPNKNFTFLKERMPLQRVILLQGSTRSAKTYSIIDFLIELCLHHRGLTIDIVRTTLKALKATAWQDFQNRLIEFGLYREADHNKTDCEYILNGNTIAYFGVDNPDKVHGRTRHILWINEAHQFPESVVNQLLPRTKERVICDYNPALGLKHWLDDYIAEFPPLITTYKDNPYLTAGQIAEIEKRKNNKYWWTIYGTGQRAAREGAIFDNWIEGSFDNTLPYCYGQDYGYSIDPTTLIKVAVDKAAKKIYTKELLYSTEPMGTNAIFKANKQLIENPNDLIIGDSAEGRLIADLRALGLNISECEKGAGSVQAGILAIQDFQIVVTPDSHNLKMELSNYVWNDKKAGIPVDAFNHLIDPLRYAFKRLDAKTFKRHRSMVL